MSRSILRITLPFISIIFFASLFRFAYLGTIPNAVSGDELHYIITAKSIFLTGHDLSGTWNPWSLFWFRYPPNEHQAELPYLLHLMVSARLPFSLFFIRLPFAVLSVGIVVLVAAVSYELFGLEAAVAAGGVAAINPWLIVMGRTGYEATPAMFFYLLSFWAILKLKKWNVLWTGIPLVLAFYSYIATKVLFVPFIGAICIFAYIKHRGSVKPYLTVFSLSVVLAGVFFILSKIDSSGSRLGDLFFLNSSDVAQTVNSMRRTTITSPLMSVLINKYVIYAQTILDKVFRIFSLSYLFVDGDQFFLPIKQGFFYYLDAIFMFIGAIYIGLKHKTYAWPLLFLIAVSAIPQLASTTMGDFSIHLTLLFPLVTLIVGAGISGLILSVPKKIRVWVLLACIGLYLVNVAGFTETYFYRSPLVGYADFPKRILANYLQLASERHLPVTVYASSNSDVFQKYMLYTDVITKQNIPALRKAILSPSIKFNSLHFLSCGAPDTVAAGSTVITDTGCGKPVSDHHQSITRLTDGGENYIIDQDFVCNTYALKPYAQDITFPDFAIEHLSEKQFCETYISQR